MNDDELRGSFEALKAHDRASAPSFARMRAEAERRARARRMRTGAVLSATFAIAAMVVLAIWIVWPDPTVVVAASPAPLEFLLEPPSASVLGGEAPIDQIGEAW